MKVIKYFLILINLFVILSVPVSGKNIRVLLKKSSSSRHLTSNKGMIIYDLSWKKGVKVIAFRKAKVSYSRNRIEVYVNGKTYREKGLIFKPKSGGNIHFNGKYYRGILMIIPESDNDRFWVINVLDMESYLKGVLAAEIPHSWHIEALKAQAIAARTYAYEKVLNNSSKSKYDVCATDMSQVYGGISSERESTTKAVNETKNYILTYKKRPIAAFFHSTCGGSTDDAEYVWGKKFPYLRRTTCKYCSKSPHSKWTYTVSLSDLKKRLENKGYEIGYIKRIRMIGKTNGGRIKKVEIKGSKKTITLNSNNFRILVGARYLKSTRFSAKLYSNKIKFTGSGFGHGIGLCQWGAKGMAERGYKYQAILKFYYKNVRISKIK